MQDGGALSQNGAPLVSKTFKDKQRTSNAVEDGQQSSKTVEDTITQMSGENVNKIIKIEGLTSSV